MSNRDILSYDLWQRKDLAAYFTSILNDQVKLKPDYIKINNTVFDLNSTDGHQQFIVFTDNFKQMDQATQQALGQIAKIHLSSSYVKPITTTKLTIVINFDLAKFINTLLLTASDQEIIDAVNSILILRLNLRMGKNAKEKDNKSNSINRSINSEMESEHTEYYDEPTSNTDVEDAKEPPEENTKVNKDTENNLESTDDEEESENTAPTNPVDNNPLTNELINSSVETHSNSEPTKPVNTEFANTEPANTNSSMNTESAPYIDQSSTGSNYNNQAISVPTGSNAADTINSQENNSNPMDAAFDKVLNNLGQDTDKDTDIDEEQTAVTSPKDIPASDDNLANDNKIVMDKIIHNNAGEIIDDSDNADPLVKSVNNFTNTLKNFGNAQQETKPKQAPNPLQTFLKEQDHELAKSLANID